MVLVDTPVWSLALRRRADTLTSDQRRMLVEWADLVRQGRAQLIGPVRQELLSRLRHQSQFDALRLRLSAFPDAPIDEADYVEAARLFNLCQVRGVTGAQIDLLICAVAKRYEWPIFSLDQDFERYARFIPIRLHRLARR